MLTIPRQYIASLVVALVITVVAASGVAAARQPMALGVSMNGATDMSVVDSFSVDQGRRPAIWSLWSSFGGGDQEFPSAAAAGLRDRGIVPMIYWGPTGGDGTDCSRWSLDAFLRGDHDAYIRQWAQAAKDHGGRVIVRFAYEMNGYWYIWGLGRCTNTAKKFRQAWQRVVNIFRGQNGVGATNVKFLWSVFGLYKLPALYPGNSYVDYMGLTAFNWAQPGHPAWKSMVKTMAPTMGGLRSISTTKPIIAAEIAAGYNPNCATCNKVAYIANGYPAVYAKWPQVVAMVYFNIDMRGFGQPDWRLNSPPGAFNAYKNIVADPRFQGAIP